MKILWIHYIILKIYNFKCSWKIQPILSYLYISTKHWIIQLAEKYHNHVERSMKRNIARRMAMHRKNSNLYEEAKKNRLDKCKWIWESESSLNGMRSNDRTLIKDDQHSR